MSQPPPDLSQQFADFFPDPVIRRWAKRLMERMLDGHICVPCSDLGDGAEQSPSPFILEGSAVKWVSVGDEAHVKPFVCHKEMLYLQRYFLYETEIVERIRARAERSRLKWNERADELVILRDAGYTPAVGISETGDGGFNQTDWQTAAVIRALCSDFGIITGGPGTGKTTTLVRLLEGVHRLNPNARVALAAPTGKASMRMLESIRQQSGPLTADLQLWLGGLKPFTLHRLLGYVPHSIYFKYNRNRPLPYDWVVIDEASMVDVPMFAKLLEACAPETRLLLLGDKDQLASVESGSLLGDLCASAGALNRFAPGERERINQFVIHPQRKIGPEAESDEWSPLGRCITELRWSHRFKTDSGVGRLARAVLGGQASEAVDVLRHPPNENELMWYPGGGSDAWVSVLGDVLKAYKSYLEAEDVAEALHRFKEYRVLTPVREGQQGLHTLNLKIEEALRQRYPSLIGQREVFYRNRPLLVTRNDYALGLFNGDIGLVRPDPAHHGQLRVWFEANEEGGGLRSIHPSAIGACETAYVMTIHKSQGSEFDRVLMVLPEREEHKLLTRELIYTGITRARKHLAVWGPEAVFMAGVERNIQRISGLAERLR
jgi:exodeoxyribonuclease V alpha subunit